MSQKREGRDRNKKKEKIKSVRVLLRHGSRRGDGKEILGLNRDTLVSEKRSLPSVALSLRGEKGDGNTTVNRRTGTQSQCICREVPLSAGTQWGGTSPIPLRSSSSIGPSPRTYMSTLRAHELVCLIKLKAPRALRKCSRGECESSAVNVYHIKGEAKSLRGILGRGKKYTLCGFIELTSRDQDRGEASRKQIFSKKGHFFRRKKTKKRDCLLLSPGEAVSSSDRLHSALGRKKEKGRDLSLGRSSPFFLTPPFLSGRKAGFDHAKGEGRTASDLEGGV